jgi:modulator of FtsH protease HflK
MKRSAIACALLLAAYLATGFYVIRGNEQGLVVRFGKARRPLVASGLHYDLPWPLSRIERINLNQARTLTVGIVGGDGTDIGGFLREVNVDRQGEFVTGDKNILNVQINVQYRVSDPFQFLFLAESAESRLKLAVESLATDLIGRSGVDYVHPLGLNELRDLLTQQTRELAESQTLGVAVDDVTIAGVFPPVEVKAAFLDVSNARAEKERMINAELSRGEQLLASARAAASQQIVRAETAKNTRIEAARGAADRFLAVIGQFRREAETGGTSVATVRRHAMQRLFAATLEQILPKLAGKVFIDSEKPVDLTIFPEGEKKPAPAGRP